MPRQIFATKSIDKLISDSERPEHALKKSLGPVSLTLLGHPKDSGLCVKPDASR